MEILSKLALVLCFTGAIAISITATTTTAAPEGDVVTVITAEEQNKIEATTATTAAPEGDVVTVITAKEQNMVENSSDLEGFVPQEQGSGFHFIKVVK